MMQHDANTLRSDVLRARDPRTAARMSGGLDAPGVDARALEAFEVGARVAPDLQVVARICASLSVPDANFQAVRGTHGWRGPEAEFVAADLDAVVAALSDAFTDAFGQKRWRSRPLEDRSDAWIVGTWEIGGMSTTVVLARGLDATLTARRTRDALAALAPNDAGLVLTVGDDAGFEPPPRFASLPLADSIRSTDGCRLSVIAGLITRAVNAQAARLVAHAGRPSVEAKVFAVLNHLKACGKIDEETKGLSGIVERHWDQFHPNEAAPRPSTLRKHIRSWRKRGAI